MISLLAAAAVSAWPARCVIPAAMADKFHPAESTYMDTMAAYTNATTIHANAARVVYDENVRVWRTNLPVWDRRIREINGRYDQLKRLQGGKITKDQYDLYELEFDALGPAPKHPDGVVPYRVQDVVGETMMADLAAHKTRVDAWTASFGSCEMYTIYGITVTGVDRVLAATRDTLTIDGGFIGCGRAPIPSIESFWRMYALIVERMTPEADDDIGNTADDDL
jgi:hypothetical protein